MCVFGDSIVWGSWDHEGGGWVERLRRAQLALALPDYTHWEIHNHGIPGETVADVARRIVHEAPPRSPDLIVVAAGTNDAPHSGKPATSGDRFEADFTALLENARTAASRVVAVTPTNVDESRPEHDWRNSDIAALVAIAERCADRAEVPLINVFGLLEPSDLDPDGIHPGNKGHLKLADKLGPLLLS